MGRPTVMTDDIVRKLLEVIKLDVTVEEACLYAGISKDTYYRKLKEDEGFSDEIARSRMYPTLAARSCVVKHLATNPHLAFKYLERRRPEEFAPHQIQPPEMIRINLGAESIVRMKEFLLPPIPKKDQPKTVSVE